MRVGDFLGGLEHGGYWDEPCACCGMTFPATEGETECPGCREDTDRCRGCFRRLESDDFGDGLCSERCADAYYARDFCDCPYHHGRAA